MFKIDIFHLTYPVSETKVGPIRVITPTMKLHETWKNTNLKLQQHSTLQQNNDSRKKSNKVKMDTQKIVGKYLFIYFDIYILQTLDYMYGDIRISINFIFVSPNRSRWKLKTWKFDLFLSDVKVENFSANIFVTRNLLNYRKPFIKLPWRRMFYHFISLLTKWELRL